MTYSRSCALSSPRQPGTRRHNTASPSPRAPVPRPDQSAPADKSSHAASTVYPPAASHMANLALLVVALAAPRVAAASWPAAEAGAPPAASWPTAEAGAPPAATTGPSPSTLLADLRERKLVAQTCPANCGGSAHGHCVGRSCVCKGGWSGLDCTVESLLMKRCRKLRKAIKRVVNAKKRKKRNKRTRKLAKKRTNLQQKGITDATCGLTCVDGTMCVDECGVAIGDGLTCADECGVPNGDDSTCTDACGVPLGDGSTCR